MNISKLRQLLQDALAEDIGMADLTSQSLIPEKATGSGRFEVKEAGTIAGLTIIEETYRILDPDIKITLNCKDGETVKKGQTVAEAYGSVASMLTGERVVLNLLQHLSGIATATKKAVDTLQDSAIKICDTRKTLPGLRMLEKYAVRCGGGYNHRMGLDNGIIIKDNHISYSGSIKKAVESARSKTGPMTRIEVEVKTRKQVQEAVEAEADVIMFDNFTPEEVSDLKKLVPRHIKTEVSGGITLENLAGYRNTNVDYISLGMLTHSARALDISFNLNENV